MDVVVEDFANASDIVGVQPTSLMSDETPRHNRAMTFVEGCSSTRAPVSRSRRVQYPLEGAIRQRADTILHALQSSIAFCPGDVVHLNRIPSLQSYRFMPTVWVVQPNAIQTFNTVAETFPLLNTLRFLIQVGQVDCEARSQSHAQAGPQDCFTTSTDPDSGEIIQVRNQTGSCTTFLRFLFDDMYFCRLLQSAVALTYLMSLVNL